MESKPFGTVLRDLLLDHGFTTPMGNPNWASFALELPTTGYESLRKAVTGERPPGEKIMEEAAGALKVEPELFVEYRLQQAAKAFDPKIVGDEVALNNLELWVEAQTSKPARRSAAKRA